MFVFGVAAAVEVALCVCRGVIRPVAFAVDQHDFQRLADDGDVFSTGHDEGDAEQDEGVQADREQCGERQALRRLLQHVDGRIFHAGTSTLA